MKKKRWIAYLLVISLLIGDVLRWSGPIMASAAELDAATEIRLLDGKATLKELFTAFGGGSKDYHYSLEDQIAWKRVNYDDRNSESLAENIWNQKTYILEQDSNSWKTIGTFYFQFYHNVTVKTEGQIPNGGGVSVSGEQVSTQTFEVNDGMS